MYRYKGHLTLEDQRKYKKEAFSEGKCCPDCGVLINNRSSYCKKHARKDYSNRKGIGLGRKLSEYTKGLIKEKSLIRYKDPKYKEKVIKHLIHYERQENNMWVGDNAKYGSKHAFIRRNYFADVNECQQCGSESNLQLSNKTHTYNRNDENDWQILCAKCHYHYDLMMGFRKKQLYLYKKNV